MNTRAFLLLVVASISSSVIADPPCSVSDVGCQGGAAVPDNKLDINDFVAFIDLFFTEDPRADLGACAGEGSDSLFNNSDFVFFINHFFNDAANCTG